MGDRIAIYTASFGDRDTLKPPVNYQKEDIDYFFFSNERPNYNIEPYKFVSTPMVYKDITKNARQIKILGAPILIPYSTTIWHDANMQINHSNLKRLIDTIEDSPFSTFKHPDRDDFYSEAMSCIRVKKDSAIKLLRQSIRYFFKGLPAHSGIYSTGILVKVRSAKTNDFYSLWWSEVLKYSRRDQLALSYVIHVLNAEVNIIDGDIYNNSYIKYHDHNYLEYRYSDDNVKTENYIIRKLSFYIVKMMRKLSKLRR